MSFMNWCDELAVDVSWLDTEHRAMVDLLNEIHASIEAGGNSFRLHYLLDRLVSLTELHFTEEEKKMLQLGYPKYENHRLQHKVLLNEIRLLQTAYREDYVTLSSEALAHMKSWLTNHIAGMDADLALFLKQLPDNDADTNGPTDR
jgi:hemerythrin-like metal-binding protein